MAPRAEQTHKRTRIHAHAQHRALRADTIFLRVLYPLFTDSSHSWPRGRLVHGPGMGASQLERLVSSGSFAAKSEVDVTFSKIIHMLKKKRERHKQDYLRQCLFPPRVKSSMRGNSTFRADTLTLAMEVVCSITVSSKSDRDWVARIAQPSQKYWHRWSTENWRLLQYLRPLILALAGCRCIHS